MKNYYVEWVIDVDADTPEDAAKMAEAIQQDAQPAFWWTRQVFTVMDEETNQVWDIDLAEVGSKEVE